MAIDTQAIKEHIRGILIALGDDPDREGLKDTPDRVARMYQEVFEGMQYTNREIAEMFDKTFEEEMDFVTDSRDMVIVRDIELYSLCEHHLLPFIGKAHVAYIPTGKVLGLSKVARIVDMFARRLQIQENLTRQIAEAVRQVTSAAGVAVVIEAQHMCMMMRGVEKQNSQMFTSVMLGAFRDSNTTRQEFLQLIGRSK